MIECTSRSAPQKLHSLWISANERHDVVCNILHLQYVRQKARCGSEAKRTENFMPSDPCSWRGHRKNWAHVLSPHQKSGPQKVRKPQTRYQYALNLSKDPPRQTCKDRKRTTYWQNIRLHSSKEFNPTRRSPWLLLHLAALLLLSRPLHGAKVNKQQMLRGPLA